MEEARSKLKESIANGKAFEQFKTFLASQGGDASVADYPENLPQAEYKIELPSLSAGTVSKIIADDIGTAAMMLGAGRATKDSVIDLAVGIVLHKKIGDSVEEGEALLTIHANQENVDEVRAKLYDSIVIATENVPAPTLVYDTVTK
jgi:pyrimidine-nucleoside phosphorylase